MNRKCYIFHAARICITHSFNLQTIEDYIGKKDVSDNQLEKIQSLLDSYEYDDYDRLIQLLDSTCNADGTKNLEKRMEDVKNRYGYYPKAKYDKNFELKAYFEKLMGKKTFADVLGQYVTKPAGKLTLVPVSDKRPEVSVNTVNDEFQED